MTPVELIKLMRKFVEGRDRSIEIANQIEVGLDELYGEKEPYAEAVNILARYRPGGGDLLTSENDVVAILAHLLKFAEQAE